MSKESTAFEEALRRIESWNLNDCLDLAIPGLTSIPESIAELNALNDLRLFIRETDEDGLKTHRYAAIQSLSPLVGLTSLQRLDCFGTSINDLTPLSGLKNLQQLDCSRTSIRNLAPLSGLKDLRRLMCPVTLVDDLTPLSDLENLQQVSCSLTSVSNLTPLSDLENLRQLDCFDTPVSDLTPLSSLTNLQHLSCPFTSVSNLTPLSGLENLQHLNCSSTSVSNLTPLSGLENLQHLNCSSTSVSNLTPLSGLENLQYLDCSRTSVSDLSVLVKLNQLSGLDISYCNISESAECIQNIKYLRELIAYKTTIVDVPVEVLSREFLENCLNRLLAHLQDNAVGAVKLLDAKLMVLGNSQVGKTQLCRWLRKKPFDESIPSTHGVTITRIPSPSNPDAQIHLWDFGGQDIYHATHALFLRSRAIFLIAWMPALKCLNEVIKNDRLFRNYPLPYWIDYVHEFGGPDAHLIIVQTQCDTRDDDAVLDPETQVRLQHFTRQDNTVFSARTSRRGAVLLEMINDACSVIDTPLIGVGRARVKAHLETLRDADAKENDPGKRVSRTMSLTDFNALCTKIGGVVDTEHLAEFLHDCGTVFYQKGLFNNQLIIDQAWALEAIYAVFHRGGCLQVLESLNGQFTRTLLGELLWNHRGLNDNDQKMILKMMQSCGICFEYQEEDRKNGIEARYIAPDLLPTEPPRPVFGEWDDQAPYVSEAFSFPFLTSTLMLSTLSRIGSDATQSAHYWRNGVYFFDQQRHSRAKIVQTWTSDCSGEIQIRCQTGEAQLLLQVLVELVFQQIERLGFKPDSMPDKAGRQPREDRHEPVPITYGREHTERRWYVSYARKDETRNDKLVNRFCEHARAHQVGIQRDEKQLVPGDSISRFMHKMAKGERIYVFLSEAYLQSIFCMTELHGIWARCDRDEDNFARCVRVFLSDDTSPGDVTQMLIVREYWLQKLQAFDEIPTSDTTPRMRATTDQLKVFAHQTYDLLEVIYDRVQFREEALLFNDVTREE